MNAVLDTDKSTDDASDTLDGKSCPLFNHGCDEIHEVLKEPFCEMLLMFFFFLVSS